MGRPDWLRWRVDTFEGSLPPSPIHGVGYDKLRQDGGAPGEGRFYVAWFPVPFNRLMALLHWARLKARRPILRHRIVHLEIEAGKLWDEITELAKEVKQARKAKLNMDAELVEAMIQAGGTQKQVDEAADG